MRVENQRMKAFLKANGIDAMPMYIKDGSVKGSWRLYGLAGKNPDGSPIYQNWWNNFDLQIKLNMLGFTDLWGQPLDNASGNGGVFSVFVRGHNELLKEQPQVVPVATHNHDREHRRQVRLDKTARRYANRVRRGIPTVQF